MLYFVCLPVTFSATKFTFQCLEREVRVPFHLEKSRLRMREQLQEVCHQRQSCVCHAKFHRMSVSSRSTRQEARDTLCWVITVRVAQVRPINDLNWTRAALLEPCAEHSERRWKGWREPNSSCDIDCVMCEINTEEEFLSTRREQLHLAIDLVAP